MRRIQVAAAVLEERGRFFATQRGGGPFRGKWEFPGGKLEPGECAQQALIREIREELDTEIAVVEYLTTVEYDAPDFHLSMACFLCRVCRGELTLKEHMAGRWLFADEMDELDWLPADRAVVELLQNRMGGNAT